MSRIRVDPSPNVVRALQLLETVSYHHEYSQRTRVTDAPVALDVPMQHTLGSPQQQRPAQPPMPAFLVEISKHWAEITRSIPKAWLGMGAYLAAGVFLGLVVIGAMTLGHSGQTKAEAAVPPPAPNAIFDNVVRLHAREIGNTCWTAFEKQGPARLTVALEVGVDGKIRYAAASGETPAMRECVETHVRSWEFLPQAQPQTMALPFEVDRR